MHIHVTSHTAPSPPRLHIGMLSTDASIDPIRARSLCKPDLMPLEEESTVRAKHVRTRLALPILLLAVALFATGSPVPVHAADPPSWIWPATDARVERSFVAPVHAYAPGHRGLDLCLTTSQIISAPDDGTVAFVGQVAGRGVLTIDHGQGVVSTLEPVDSAMVVGAAVHKGDAVAQLSLGGHASAGCFHLGARLDGEYVNPMIFLGGIPRPVLLPCC